MRRRQIRQEDHLLKDNSGPPFLVSLATTSCHLEWSKNFRLWCFSAGSPAVIVWLDSWKLRHRHTCFARSCLQRYHFADCLRKILGQRNCRARWKMNCLNLNCFRRRWNFLHFNGLSHAKFKTPSFFRCAHLRQVDKCGIFRECSEIQAAQPRWWLAMTDTTRWIRQLGATPTIPT